MTDQEIYQKFVEWLDNPIFGFTESDAKMPMITAYVTPEEAEFLTGFPMSSKSPEEIAAMKNAEPEVILPKIKEMCAKGTFLW